MFRLLTALVLASLAAAAAYPARAAYPERVVRIVISFPAGGPPDILARLLAPALSTALGQSFIVDNRAGASGIIGTQAVSRSVPDGYTIMIGSIATHATNPAMYKDLPYDPVGGFTPIALLAETPLVLVANPRLSASTVRELVAMGKDGSLIYGSNSFGSTAHLSAELLQIRTGITMTHVPFKGSSPMLNDLIAGQILLAFDNLPPSLPFIRAGQIKVLAVTSALRSPMLPEVPTFAEAGIADYNASAWYGVFGPPALPPAIVETLGKAFNDAIKSSEVRARITEAGFTTLAQGPDVLAAKVLSEVSTWKAVVRTNKIEQQ